MASKAWFETFFSGLYGKVLSGVRHERAAESQARMIRRLLGLRRGQRVLDVPCGFGRIGRPMAKWGLHVVGVDLEPRYIRAARRLAAKEGLTIRFLRADMRRIGFHEEFDAAVNWFGSFGYFPEAQNVAFARRVLRALRPGGQFLIETVNKSWLLPRFQRRLEQQVEGVRIAFSARWDGRTSRVHNVWTFTCGRRTERRPTSLRVYSGPELRRLLQAVGFVDVRLYGSPPLGRLSRHSRRLIAVARRPAHVPKARRRSEGVQ